MIKLFRTVPLIAVMTLFAIHGDAQKKGKKDIQQIPIPAFAFDDNGKVIYTEVVNQDLPAGALYKKIYAWFKTHYKNPADVIQEKDDQNFVIKGKHRIRIYYTNPETGQKTGSGLVIYDIKVMCKEGRYKYEIGNFRWKKTTAYPIEKWIEENKKGYMHEYAQYLQEVDQFTKDLIANLKSTVAAKEKQKEDW